MDHQTTLRQIALELAAQQGTLACDTVDRAQKYYEFLVGPPSFVLADAATAGTTSSAVMEKYNPLKQPWPNAVPPSEHISPKLADVKPGDWLIPTANAPTCLRDSPNGGPCKTVMRCDDGLFVYCAEGKHVLGHMMCDPAGHLSYFVRG